MIWILVAQNNVWDVAYTLNYDVVGGLGVAEFNQLGIGLMETHFRINHVRYTRTYVNMIDTILLA